MRLPFRHSVPGCFLVVLIVFFPSLLQAMDLEKRVEKFVLKNGLTVLILERHMSPTVALYIRHRVGSVDEKLGETGLAHFLEHMMFKGTTTIGTKDYQKEVPILSRIKTLGQSIDHERLKGDKADQKKIAGWQEQLEKLQAQHRKLFIPNEIDRLYTENGADHFNATTSQDLTSYFVSLPSNKIELWARIEADRMVNPVFRDFYVERQVIMEERRQRVESDPDGKLYEQFLSTAFSAHPYGRPTLGWPSDMANLSQAAMAEFIRKYHAPNNTVITVVGDVSTPEVMKMIRRYFGPIPAQPLPSPLVTEEPPQMGEKRTRLAMDAHPKLMIGYHKPNMPHQDDYAFDLIESILAKGRTSRLYRRLVLEEGVAENISVVNGIPGSRYPNLFSVFATPRAPHGNDELERLIDEEIERLKNEPVGAQELEKTKNQLRADYIRGLDSNEGLANQLSYFESITGDYRYLTTYLEKLDKVTAADIRLAAQKYLNAENRCVSALVQKKDRRPVTDQSSGPSRY
ncbi:MAG TPA: pitrilysin family protein [Syntrophales bacterium]|nr:pitrilysin family protein [Syntrophales bacterium]HQA82302.1 pitrilysin family protein [Syntrophales bacterium]